MNKKAIATQAIVIIVVLFFVIIITTGILSWLALTTTNQKSLEIVDLDYLKKFAIDIS